MVSKFEVQAQDRDGYTEDSSLEDTLEDAVRTVAAWLASNFAFDCVKIFELVEVPYIVEQPDVQPTGRPPVTATVNGVTIRTL